MFKEAFHDEKSLLKYIIKKLKSEKGIGNRVTIDLIEYKKYINDKEDMDVFMAEIEHTIAFIFSMNVICGNIDELDDYGEFRLFQEYRIDTEYKTLKIQFGDLFSDLFIWD